MRVSAIVLASVLANACVHPGFTGASTADTIMACTANEPCGAGRGDSDVTVPIVLGTTAMAVIVIAVHRYVTVDDH